MAITIVGTPQAGQAADAGDVTLVFDVAPQENDVVVVFGGPSIVGASAIVGGGYTAFTADGLQGNTRSWYKVMGATPDTQVVGDGGADTRDGVAYIAYVLRGVDVTNVPDTTAIRNNASASSNPDPASITTVTDGAWVFAFASINIADATPGALSGYTGQAIATQADTFNVSVTGMYKEVASAGAEDPPAYTGWLGSTWACNTVAIRPAAGGGSFLLTPVAVAIL